MERPNWIPYTPAAVNILLDEYKEYADHLEAENKRLRRELSYIADFKPECGRVWTDGVVIDDCDVMVKIAKKALEDSDGRP